MTMANDFIPHLVARASPKNARLALPEGEDPRVIEAARLLLETGAPEEILLFGKVAVIERLLASVKLSDPRLRIIDSDDPGLHEETLAHFRTRAQAKGKDIDATEQLILGRSVLNQAAYYLASGKADAVVGGCVHTTGDVIRASLKGVGLKEGIKTLSGVFVMIKEEKSFLFADCGVVADPSPEQLVDIAQATAETYAQLFSSEPPRIAFLSFSTKGSAEHPSVQKMIDAVTAFKKRCPHIEADGELQFDAAYVPEVGARKAPGSPVAGIANCFIFPDLDAGNIGYKIAQRLGGFEAYGPILQGSVRPYLDLSRGANAKDIMVSGLLAITRI
ncbi:MAG: phosphotransacetylase [Chitinophagaceae bacterium]|nr:phosphotransacetylase [Oligoflexus sp.]